MNSLEELPKGEILSSFSDYQLNRPHTEGASEGQPHSAREEFKIRVFKYLTGDRKGQFEARPYVGFQYGEVPFSGKGGTEEQALMDSLGRIKGIPFNQIFPLREM
jgi:hypothetical protein